MNHSRVVNNQNMGPAARRAEQMRQQTFLNQIPRDFVVPDCAIKFLNNMGVTDSNAVKNAAYNHYKDKGFFQGDYEGQLINLKNKKSEYQNKIQEAQNELNRILLEIIEVERTVTINNLRN
jgi:hypothetical protein